MQMIIWIGNMASVRRGSEVALLRCRCHTMRRSTFSCLMDMDDRQGVQPNRTAHVKKSTPIVPTSISIISQICNGAGKESCIKSHVQKCSVQPHLICSYYKIYVSIEVVLQTDRNIQLSIHFQSII